jgi:hypothetical protein
MSTAPRIGRLAMLAGGLGIAAAVAATPGTASADPFPPPFDPNDFAISLNGMTLFQVGSATATSGLGDFAIADGANSNAVADGGFGDFASADGSDSFAAAGSTLANATGNNFDFASADGIGSFAEAGFNGSGDSASVAGDGSVAFVGFNGSGDSVSAIGNDTLAEAGLGTVAVPANFDFASDWGTLTAIPDVATVDAIGGSGDLAFVVDPLGTIGSEAFAGLGNNFDLAGVFGDNLIVDSVLSDFLFHIAPFF